MEEKKDIIELQRDKVKDYLVDVKNLAEQPLYDLEEVVLKLHHDFLMKDKRINLLRLRPNGVDGFITTDIERSMKKNRHWNCSWIIIKD